MDPVDHSSLPPTLLSLLCQFSEVLDAGLDRSTIQVIYRLVKNVGLNAESIAAIILTLREEIEKANGSTNR